MDGSDEFRRLEREKLASGVSNHQAAGDSCHQESPRRHFLRASVAGTILGLVTNLGSNLVGPEPASAQSTLSPDATVEELMAGNRRFTTGRMTAHEQDLAILKQNTSEKQEPFAAVLSCADSRVPVELVFDQTIGHIFVTRVAGNVVTPEIIASLEYGAAVLGTRVIMVMGHASCGAVKAAIEGKPVPGQISALYAHIQPAVDQAGKNLDAAIRANAKIHAALLRESSTVISGLVKESKIEGRRGVLRHRHRQCDPVELDAEALTIQDKSLDGVGKRRSIPVPIPDKIPVPAWAECVAPGNPSVFSTTVTAGNVQETQSCC